MKVKINIMFRGSRDGASRAGLTILERLPTT